MIKWLTKESFLSNLDELSNRGTVDYLDICAFEVDRDKILDYTGTNADVETVDFAEPGPFSRWYGFCSETPFQLTHFEGENGLTLLNAGLGAKAAFSWKLVRELGLPSAFLNGLKWIKGNPDATSSVFALDDRNLAFELYRADPKNDAVAFLSFLTSTGFARELVIDRSDDLDRDWVVRAGGREVARYTSRYDAQHFAVSRTGQFEGVVEVFAVEGPDQK